MTTAQLYHYDNYAIVAIGITPVLTDVNTDQVTLYYYVHTLYSVDFPSELYKTELVLPFYWWNCFGEANIVHGWFT